MLTVKSVLQTLKTWAPFELAWERDNIGLLAGSLNRQVHRVLVCLDVTEETVAEAVQLRCDLIVAHHPVIFRPVSSIVLETEQGRILSECLKNDISIIAAHTNVDAAEGGLNYALASRLGLTDVTSLTGAQGKQENVVLFVNLAVNTGDTFFAALRKHECVRWTVARFESKVARVEILTPEWLISSVRSLATTELGEGLLSSYAIPIADRVCGHGIGAIGMLPAPMDADVFVQHVKQTLGCDGVRTTPYQPDTKVRRVAVCGGSGSSYIGAALSANADAYVTADLTYHTFQDHRNGMILIDAGHYETEHVFVSLCTNVLNSAFSNEDDTLEIISTRTDTNPIRFA